MTDAPIAIARRAARDAGREVAGIETFAWLRGVSRIASQKLIEAHGLRPVCVWDVRGSTPLYRLSDLATALTGRARPIDPERLVQARGASVVATVAGQPVAVLFRREPARAMGAWLSSMHKGGGGRTQQNKPGLS